MDSLDKRGAEPAGADEGAETADVETSDVETSDVETAAAAGKGGWNLVIALGVAALVCAVAAGIFFMKRDSAVEQGANRVPVAAADAVGPGIGDSGNTALLDIAETERVAVAAKSVVATIFSYDYTNIDTHGDRIRPLVTADVAGQFELTEKPTLEMIKQAKTTAAATVPESGIGVRSITGDTAEVDVVLQVSGDNGGVPTAAATVPLRVTLKSVDGQWIASDIQPI